MACAEKAMLSVWGAINLLKRARECIDLTEMAESLTATETVLFAVLNRLARSAEGPRIATNHFYHHLPPSAQDSVSLTNGALD
jgi:hypothetical protein